MVSKSVDIASRLICVAVALLFIWLFFEYVLAIILPFVIAFAIGVPIYKLSFAVHRRTRIPRKLSAFILVLIFISAIGILLFFILSRLFSEIEELIAWAEGDPDGVGNIVGVVIGYVEDISSKIPFVERIENIEGLENFRDVVDEKIMELIDGLISNVTSGIPEWAISLVKGAPKAIITIIVILLSCFYFATDYANFKAALLKLFSDRMKKGMIGIFKIVSMALKRYGRAYLLIMLITFAEVSVGLLILGKKYAFLLAALIAVVDILPVFGAGTVLIPWGIIAMLMKDFRTGTGLLVLYGVITIIRQVIEPKIIGESLGIHPLITLIAMFTGLSLFGVAGMILGPCVVIVVREVLEGYRGAVLRES